MGNNPKIAALLSGAVAAWLIYSMATATETPSTALAVLQYVLIAAALLGLVGAVKRMLSDANQSPTGGRVGPYLALRGLGIWIILNSMTEKRR